MWKKGDESDSSLWIYFASKWICLAGDFARLNEFINKRNTNNNKIIYTWKRYHMWPNRKWPMTDTNQQVYLYALPTHLFFFRVAYRRRWMLRRGPRLLLHIFIHVIFGRSNIAFVSFHPCPVPIRSFSFRSQCKKFMSSCSWTYLYSPHSNQIN